MLIYPQANHLQNWLDFGHGLLISLLWALFWLCGFLVISPITHRKDGLKFDISIYPDRLQKWLYYGNSLLIFLIWAQIWLVKRVTFGGFQAFPGKSMKWVAWNLAGWCTLTSFRTDNILVTVCYFSSIWCHFDLVKLVRFEVSGQFL